MPYLTTYCEIKECFSYTSNATMNTGIGIMSGNRRKNKKMNDYLCVGDRINSRSGKAKKGKSGGSASFLCQQMKREKKNHQFRWKIGTIEVEVGKIKGQKGKKVLFKDLIQDLSTFGASWTCHFLVKDLIQIWMHFPVRKKVKAIWRAAPLFLFWAIWKERNRIIFEGANFSSRRVKLFVIRSLFTKAGLIPKADFSFVRLLLYRFYNYA